MARSLVSIVTPTWQRPELLVETIRHVRDQDYPDIEHIVISDGFDLSQLYCAEEIGNCRRGRDLRHAFLGRNWSGLMPESFGIAPLTVGYLMARGEYVMNWSDDDRALTPDHITRLVDLLESTGADFVYPKVKIWRVGDPDGPETAIIGTDPPAYCQITHMLARVSNFHRFGMPRWGTHPVDWSLVAEWMNAGARWAMLDAVTFEHRLDR